MSYLGTGSPILVIVMIVCPRYTKVTMLILFHVLSALSSIVWTTVLIFKPSLNGFRTSYILIGTTLLSGTVLVISSHSGLLQACTSGLAYLVILAVGIGLAHARWKVPQED